MRPLSELIAKGIGEGDKRAGEKSPSGGNNNHKGLVSQVKEF